MDFVEESERKKVKLEIKKSMVSLNNQNQSVVKQEPDEKPQLPSVTCAPGTSSDHTEEPPAKKIKVETNFFEDFFSDIAITKVEPAVSSMDKAKKEMKLYLTLPTEVAAGSSFSVLEWWKAHENQIPMMANFAKSVLCVPATSTPSERMFSKAGNLITKKRANLKPEKVDMMLFLNVNYKAVNTL